MNVLDSCGWLKYFADGPNAEFFAGAIEATAELAVPTISLYTRCSSASSSNGVRVQLYGRSR